MTEQQSNETAWYSINGKRAPANWAFDYRGIRHIGDPLKWSNEDEFKASVIQKYKNIDAGLNPDGTPKPVRQKAALAVSPHAIKGFKQSYTNDAMAQENAELRARLEHLESVVMNLTAAPQGSLPPLPEQDEPGSGDGSEDVPVTIPLKRLEGAAGAQDANESPTEGAAAPQQAPQQTATPAGACPRCGLQFKRLDMHIGRCKGAAGGLPGSLVGGPAGAATGA